MRRFRRGRGTVSAGLTLALVSFAVVASGPAAVAATTCSFDAVDTVTVTLDPGAAAILWSSGGDITLTEDGVGDTDCGATTAEADTINVTGDDLGDEFIQVDESGGDFAPGLTAEGVGSSEIEINVDLGDGADEVAIVGSSGNDTIAMSSSGVNLNGDADTDVLLTDVEALALWGGDGDDTLTGVSTPDGVTSKSLHGEGGGDTITSGSTADFLDGGDGDDALNGGAGNDTLIGGDGVDDIGGNTGSDTLDVTFSGRLQTAATEGLNLNLQNATVTNDGWGNVDVISALENVVGTDFDDVIKGNSAASTLTGGDGDDRLEGRAGADTLSGGNGADTVNGGNGADTMTGGAGNDRLLGGTEADSMAGGSGTDTVDYANATSRVFVDLGDGTATGQGSDTLGTIENVTGSNYADRITGDANANALVGRAGADTLTGAGGDDTLTGGDGKDVLSGGAGEDTCSGGPSTDTGASCETETGIP
jgi:Ca2+-binding RTX toxin-like protein